MLAEFTCSQNPQIPGTATAGQRPLQAPKTEQSMTAIDDIPAQTEVDDRPPSKSQLKRDAHELQDLATRLTELNQEDLARVPLTPELARAINDTRSIHKREALRRHRQYLGKLMRNADHEGIAQALQQMSDQHNRLTRLLHVMERWRDELIGGDEQDVTRFVEEFPQVDRQQLRQLVRSAKSEAAAKKPPASARKLFRLIREELGREEGGA